MATVEYGDFRSEVRAALHDEMKRRDDERHSFVVNGTAEMILTRGKLKEFHACLEKSGMLAGEASTTPFTAEEFIKNMEQDPRKDTYKFLAILLYSRCSICAAVVFFNKLRTTATWLVNADGESLLPANPADLKQLFGNDEDAQVFQSNQARFCVAIIRNKQVVVIRAGDRERLPYLKPELPLGQGSYGQVYKVLIAVGHLEYHDTDHNMIKVNKEPEDVARKDYKVLKPFQGTPQEQSVMQQIFESTSHPNLVESLGCIMVDEKFSLFLPLADCDLGKYLDEEKHPPTTWTIDAKRKVIINAIGVVDGLHYLHNELKTLDYEPIACYHLDLKPANILVFKNGQGEANHEIWKLSDFGISRIKNRQKKTTAKTGDQNLSVTNWFEERFGSNTTSHSRFSGTKANAQGPYLSPECTVSSGERTVDMRSDVWSLGCVISVLFTHIYRGAKGVEEYATQRRKAEGAGKLEQFYLHGGDWSPPPAEHPAVKEMHALICKEIKGGEGGAREARVVQKILDGLERKALQIDQKARGSAKDVKELLEQALKDYQELKDAPSDAQPTHPAPSPSRPFTLRKMLPSWSIIPKAGKSKPSATMIKLTDYWKAHEDQVVEGCEISADGDGVAYWAPDRILLCTYKYVSHKDGNEVKVKTYRLPRSSQHRFNSISLSGKYLIASTDGPSFECFIIDFKESCYYHITSSGHPGIRNLALSPDSKRLVYLVHHSAAASDDGFCSLLYADVSDINQLGSHILAASAECNSTFCLDAGSDGRTIPSVPHSLRSLSDLKDAEANCLSISDSGEVYFTFRALSGGRNATFIVWVFPQDAEFEVLVKRLKLINQDDVALSDTVFALYRNKPACVYISQQKKLYTHIWSTSGRGESTLYPVLELAKYAVSRLMMDWEDEKLYMLGTKSPRKRVLLLEVPLKQKVDGTAKVEKLVDFPDLVDHKGCKFAVRLSRPGGDRTLLVAKWDKASKQAAIYRFDLESPDITQS